MASVNPFDLLGDDDNDDLSQLIAKKAALAPTSAPPPPSQQQPKPQAKLPSKPLPPAQAVKEARNEGRGGGRGGGREGGGRGYGGGDREGGRGYGGGDRDGGRGYGGGRGRGGGGYNRDRVNTENSFSSNGAPPEEGDVDKSSGRRAGYSSPRGAYRGGGGGGRRGGYNNGDVEGERPRRVFERHSATGRGNEIKREGSGRGNWGDTEELVNTNAAEKSVTFEKQPGEEEAADASKENPVTEPEEKEPEEKEMTLEEYEKVMEEKRKALLQSLKVEERKVTVDKEFETMQQLSGKKSNNDVYAKLGSDKDKKKEIADRDERAKKSVSINEFLKPAEGERFYSPGGRGGRGRGRGPRGGGGGGFGGSHSTVSAPSIEDPGQFPNLK